MKIAVVVSSNLLGPWLDYIPKIAHTQLINIYVLKEEKISVFQRLLNRVDDIVFGKSNVVQKKNPELNIFFLEEKNLKKELIKYDLTISFIKVKQSILENIKAVTFTVSGNRNVQKAIFYHTICEYKEVAIDLHHNDVKQNASVRFDPFSFNRNVDLTLHTFLSLLKSYFTTKRVNIKETNLNLFKKTDHCVSFADYSKYFVRYIKKTIHYFFYEEQWILGYHFSKNTSVVIDLKSIEKIKPPKDRFWADPIVVFENDKYYVFIEELIYKNKIAHISVFEMTKEGKYSNPIKILEKPYHLSYPFVFKKNNRYYMIPETANDNNIQLYEATKFPYEWSLKKILLDGIKASDTTLFEHNQKWWLFTSIKEFEYGMYDNNLYIYYSDDLLEGNWTSHKLNPIKRDISNSRQGGPFFNDNQYGTCRVSQNCSERYGYGFNINKIEVLNENEYIEKLVNLFEPTLKQKEKGVHTYNQIDNKIKFVDILINKRRFL